MSRRLIWAFAVLMCPKTRFFFVFFFLFFCFVFFFFAWCEELRCPNTLGKYNKKDTDQPVYPPCVARVLVYPALDSLEAVKGTCDQRKLRSDCADAQSDLSLRWSHKSSCRSCRALVYIIFLSLLLLYLKNNKPLQYHLLYLYQIYINPSEIRLKPILPHFGFRF